MIRLGEAGRVRASRRGPKLPSTSREPARCALIHTDFLSEAILSTRSDAIVGADSDGIIRFWNPGAERIFGHSSNDAVGQSLYLIIPERLRQRHWDGYRKTMATGQSRYGEGDLLSVPAVRKDGTTISIEFTIVPLKDATGKLIGIMAILRDVTKRFEEMRLLIISQRFLPIACFLPPP
jgi:PAS domain S-box-containing protein